MSRTELIFFCFLDEEEEDNLAHFSAEEDGDLDFNSSRQEIQLFLADKSSFGQWEKHTKGIGSKLMAKMGYVHGTGLGKEGEGRTEPVEAMVFPPGRSLGNSKFRNLFHFCLLNKR